VVSKNFFPTSVTFHEFLGDVPQTQLLEESVDVSLKRCTARHHVIDRDYSDLQCPNFCFHGAAAYLLDILEKSEKHLFGAQYSV